MRATALYLTSDEAGEKVVLYEVWTPPYDCYSRHLLTEAEFSEFEKDPHSFNFTKTLLWRDLR